MAFGAGLTRGAQLLTHRSIETLRPAEAPYRVTDQRCKGLAVRIAPSGVKTWDLAYRIRGAAKMRRLSLGRTTDVSLEQARERANELTGAARGGRDLVAEEEDARGAAASRVTVGKLIDLYLRRRVIGRLRTGKSIESRLRRTLAPILQRHAADICRRDIPRDLGQHRRPGQRSRSGKAQAGLHRDVPVGAFAGHRRRGSDRGARGVRPWNSARSGADCRRNRDAVEVVGVRCAFS
jgi:hypothetical protein